jgi:putative transcriptional regulator
MAMDLWVAPGTLLASGPDLMDPNFMHTVVLVCQHTREGAYGLVVNRLSGSTTDDVLAEHPVFGRARFPVWIGGPVGLDTLQILHCIPDEVPQSFELAEGVWIGGDLDRLADFLSREPDRARRSVRMFRGYAGWGEGQLEAELASGSWLPAPGEAARVFHHSPDRLWRDVVRSLGEAAEGLDEQPPDPHWN